MAKIRYQTKGYIEVDPVTLRLMMNEEPNPRMSGAVFVCNVCMCNWWMCPHEGTYVKYIVVKDKNEKHGG